MDMDVYIHVCAYRCGCVHVCTYVCLSVYCVYALYAYGHVCAQVYICNLCVCACGHVCGCMCIWIWMCVHMDMDEYACVYYVYALCA